MFRVWGGERDPVMHLAREIQRKQGCLLRQWWQVELAERSYWNWKNTYHRGLLPSPHVPFVTFSSFGCPHPVLCNQPHMLREWVIALGPVWEREGL